MPWGVPPMMQCGDDATSRGGWGANGGGDAEIPEGGTVLLGCMHGGIPHGPFQYHGGLESEASGETSRTMIKFLRWPCRVLNSNLSSTPVVVQLPVMTRDLISGITSHWIAPRRAPLHGASPATHPRLVPVPPSEPPSEAEGSRLRLGSPGGAPSSHRTVRRVCALGAAFLQRETSCGSAGAAG